MATNHEVVSSNLTGQVSYLSDTERLSSDSRFFIGDIAQWSGLLWDYLESSF
jgi:hypothetical protein